MQVVLTQISRRFSAQATRKLWESDNAATLEEKWMEGIVTWKWTMKSEDQSLQRRNLLRIRREDKSCWGCEDFYVWTRLWVRDTCLVAYLSQITLQSSSLMLATGKALQKYPKCKILSFQGGYSHWSTCKTNHTLYWSAFYCPLPSSSKNALGHSLFCPL